VVEPTKSGLHDIKRLVELVHKFKIPMCAVINKSDINPVVTNEIEEYLNINAIRILAKIPFDETMVDAMVNGQSIIEFKPDSEITTMLKQVWKELKRPIPIKTFHIETNDS